MLVGSGLYDNMIQRISVRLLLRNNDKILLLRRSDGRESILQKYELPGGRVFQGEQPEDSLLRYLKSDLSIEDSPNLSLKDVFTYNDADDREIQYAVIVYESIVDYDDSSIKLSSHYDKKVWTEDGKASSYDLTGLTKILLNIAPSALESFEPKVSIGRLTVYTDGGSRGNPGPSAAGFVLVDTAGNVVDQGGEYLGITTSSQAEYQAVKLGLERALSKGWLSVDFKVDSMLVVNHLTGLVKVNNRELWPVYENIKKLLTKFEKVNFIHVPRELNKLADGMANNIIDKTLSSKR